jgi:hypothetical protein
LVAEVAYRFLPCDDEGRPRDGSQYTTVVDDDEDLGVGSVIEAAIFGYREWEVIEVRETPAPLIRAADADGSEIPLGGTLVCRGLR